MSKLPYKEGNVFAIPLRDGRYALGVIARAPKAGKVLLGYFFGYVFGEIPDESELPVLKPADSIKIARFGDLSLINGEWPIISNLTYWEYEEWFMPKFIKQDPLSKKAWLVSYDNKSPNLVISEEVCDFNTHGYERASLMGSGSVELALTRLLKNSPKN